MIHNEKLQLYLRLLLQLKNIYLFQFNQSQWLKQYVEFNTTLYKLINNVVCGNAVENLRNRINVKRHKKVVATISHNDNNS